MNILRRQRWRNHFFGWFSCTLILLLFSFIPVRLAIAYNQSPHPQAILTLGGGADREVFAAQLAKRHPSLEIWVSSGTIPENAQAIFREAGIPDARVHLDYRAVDTVTNFTSLVRDFKSRDIQHLYIITSDFHMPRAKAIATIVLGSQGIAFTPVSIPSNKPLESRFHVLRDVGRAGLWLITGHTGARLYPTMAKLSKVLDFLGMTLQYSLVSPAPDSLFFSCSKGCGQQPLENFAIADILHHS